MQKELDEYGDIVFVKEKTNYKSILVKTYFVLEYAALHYDARYILKTDDDAYINIGALLRQLRLLCQTADCRHERLYMGKMAKARARAAARPPGVGSTASPRGPAPLSRAGQSMRRGGSCRRSLGAKLPRLVKSPTWSRNLLAQFTMGIRAACWCSGRS